MSAYTMAYYTLQFFVTIFVNEKCFTQLNNKQNTNRINRSIFMIYYSTDFTFDFECRTIHERRSTIRRIRNLNGEIEQKYEIDEGNSRKQWQFAAFAHGG